MCWIRGKISKNFRVRIFVYRVKCAGPVMPVTVMPDQRRIFNDECGGANLCLAVVDTITVEDANDLAG